MAGNVPVVMLLNSDVFGFSIVVYDYDGIDIFSPNPHYTLFFSRLCCLCCLCCGKLKAVYQTAQKMTVGHLIHHCSMVPSDIRDMLQSLKDEKSRDGGGIRYWTEGVSSLNVYETEAAGLAFSSRKT